MKRRRQYDDIAPDEILIDAQNIPGFDAYRVEGKIERPIERRAFRNLSIAVVAIACVFLFQLGKLETVDRAQLSARAEANRLTESTITAARGTIVDRNGTVLATNVPGGRGYATRAYPLGEAAAQVVGYVSYPRKDSAGNPITDATRGVAGVEAGFDGVLAGINGDSIEETDAHGAIVSGSVVHPPTDGATVALSLDAGLQQELYRAIKARADETSFVGGSGVVIDVTTGEILAMASYPSYDPGVISAGAPASEVNKYLANVNGPFLNRAVTGLYTPGSVVKPFVALAALAHRTIDPEKQILSTGSISVPNPYDPTHPSVFKDWRPNGWVDMRHGIAYSSDVYFYEVGGGFEGQQGLGISAIKSFMQSFGFAALTGIALPGEAAGTIPDPAWKATHFSGEQWYLGDTYHTAIGQYGFQLTPIELARAVAALANGGTLVSPTVIKGQPGEQTTLGIPAANMTVVHEGMRLAVTDPLGTAKALAIPGVEVAGKTGTAQLGYHNEFTNSLVIGFFPYGHPRYAFAVVMEKAKAGQSGAPAAMGEVLNWIVANRPDMVN